MKSIPLNRTVLVNRLAEIERDLAEMIQFQSMSTEAFCQGVHYAVAEHHLRRALEAIFDAGNHILSRFPLAPGQRPETYKAIALALGRHRVVPEPYAQGPLAAMAGYRNRLIHFYDEVSPEELHEIIQSHLSDIETFAKSLKEVIADPSRIGLSFEP